MQPWQEQVKCTATRSPEPHDTSTAPVSAASLPEAQVDRPKHARQEGFA